MGDTDDMNKAKVGVIIMTVSLLVMVVDRVTSSISTFIGELICGDTYMCAVDGIVGDCSCGFNTDLHLAFSLVVTLILGFLLYLSSKKVKLPE